jgi:hypothetical protein
MARKKSNEAPNNTNRRTSEQMIADLQARIQLIKSRASASELKKSPSVRATLTIVRQLDKTLDMANDEGNQVRHALAQARKPIADYLHAQGVRLPKPRLPRGRKPKSIAGN